MSALDLALSLGMHRSATHMAHLPGLDIFRQFTRDVARAIIRHLILGRDVATGRAPNVLNHPLSRGLRRQFFKEPQICAVGTDGGQGGIKDYVPAHRRLRECAP